MTSMTNWYLVAVAALTVPFCAPWLLHIHPLLVPLSTLGFPVAFFAGFKMYRAGMKELKK